MFIVQILAVTLVYASILTIVGFGGMFAEHSGVINLGLEGCMTIGAFAAALVIRVLPSDMNSFLACLIVVLVAVAAGFLYSMLLAFAAINFKADQTITGTALNIFAPSIAVVIIKALTITDSTPAGTSRLKYTDFYDKFTFSFPGAESIKFNWFIIIVFVLVPLVWFLLYKTRYGLRLMACGEHPQAADAAGINVKRVRYTGVGLSGMLAGLGGLALIMTGGEWEFAAGANGFGFLALAVMIFGQWKPITIFLGSLLFGLFKTVSILYGSIPFLSDLNISSYVYLALPYVVCLIVLIFTSKKSKAPKAEGIPYDKGQRT
jgi:ABC-type uncharacterized transport system permease subunit